MPSTSLSQRVWQSGQLKEKRLDLVALKNEFSETWPIDHVVDILAREPIHNLVLGPYVEPADADIERLIKAGVGRELRRIEIQATGKGGGITRTGATALIAGPWMEQLEVLWLEGQTLLGSDIDEILKGEFPKLKELSLRGCGIGQKGAQVLAESPLLAKIEPSALVANNLDDGALRMLASSEHVSELIELDLSNNRITAEGLTALHEGNFSSLERIHLNGNKIGPRGIKVLTKFQTLKEISLSKSAISTDPVRKAFEEGAWPSLERFSHTGPLDLDLRRALRDRRIDLKLDDDPEEKLFQAVHQHNERSVKRALKIGADPNPLPNTEGGNSPLREAVIKGKPEIVALLLEAGADPNILGPFGDSPVFLAAKLGHIEILRLLAQKEANLETPNEKGTTPFEISKGPCRKFFIEQGLEETPDEPPEIYVPQPEDTVIHKKFGEGIVKEVSGSGDRIFVSVEFSDNKTPRKMLARFLEPKPSSEPTQE